MFLLQEEKKHSDKAYFKSSIDKRKMQRNVPLRVHSFALSK